MRVVEALKDVRRLFLDTAPVIYFIEKNPSYFPQAKEVFALVDADQITVVTSPVTLAECLIVPIRNGLESLERDFTDLIVYGNHTEFATIDEVNARQAAYLRAQYGLSLMDALQISTALTSGCDAFLTNDLKLKRVSELTVIVIGELSP